jgi:UDP-N-acetyl-D-galactosamine dehydrogenase
MTTIAVVGLGYVGLPLVLEFGKKFRTVGFDLSKEKVERCSQGQDPSRELPDELFRQARLATFTPDPADLAGADVIIVAVPTPVDAARRPDLGPLLSASETIGRHMRPGATVVYESTVFPGCTEDECIPMLEAASGLKWKEGFFVGYSPERINPGDMEHSLTRVIKVVAGDTPETLERLSGLYGSVVAAGVHRCGSIKVAEASKVIENTQRDLNIALMNELAIIFHLAGIDTMEVLKASGTKWNFLNFRPGLVGGHCIGVDPYYLTHKAVLLGYEPQVILAGRRINDGMGKYVAEQTVKRLIHAGISVKGARVVVLGLSFKENCPDIRNSKVVDVARELAEYGCQVHVHDPLVDPRDAHQAYGLDLEAWETLPRGADAVVAAVPHRAFLERPVQDLCALLHPSGVFMDVKSAFDTEALRRANLEVWRL